MATTEGGGGGRGRDSTSVLTFRGSWTRRVNPTQPRAARPVVAAGKGERMHERERGERSLLKTHRSLHLPRYFSYFCSVPGNGDFGRESKEIGCVNIFYKEGDYIKTFMSIYTFQNTGKIYYIIYLSIKLILHIRSKIL
jgi:hypothetical protein